MCCVPLVFGQCHTSWTEAAPSCGGEGPAVSLPSLISPKSMLKLGFGRNHSGSEVFSGQRPLTPTNAELAAGDHQVQLHHRAKAVKSEVLPRPPPPWLLAVWWFRWSKTPASSYPRAKRKKRPEDSKYFLILLLGFCLEQDGLQRMQHLSPTKN